MKSEGVVDDDSGDNEEYRYEGEEEKNMRGRKTKYVHFFITLFYTVSTHRLTFLL